MRIYEISYRITERRSYHTITATELRRIESTIRIAAISLTEALVRAHSMLREAYYRFKIYDSVVGRIRYSDLELISADMIAETKAVDDVIEKKKP